jgi:hypothetical protein
MAIPIARVRATEREFTGSFDTLAAFWCTIAPVSCWPVNLDGHSRQKQAVTSR